jgi:hypothetical protein
MPSLLDLLEFIRRKMIEEIAVGQQVFEPRYPFVHSEGPEICHAYDNECFSCYN